MKKDKVLGEKQLQWLRDNMPGFKKHEGMAAEKVRSEQIYRRLKNEPEETQEGEATQAA